MCRAGVITTVVLVSVLLSGCLDRGTKNSAPTDEGYLVLVESRQDDGTPIHGFVNAQGDTIIAPGKYLYSFTDTIRHYGLVLTGDGECVAIDRTDSLLYNVYWYDNGPDHVERGLFRITDADGNIGYASAEDGHVVIEPRFAVAEPFHQEWARVADEAVLIPLGEQSFWEADEWYYIDREGNRMPDIPATVQDN